MVVLPPVTETLNAKTMKLLEDYAKAGGAVLCCGAAAGAGRRPAVGPRRRSWPSSPAGSRSTPDALPEMLAALRQRRLRDPPQPGRQGHPLPPAPAAGRRRAAVPGQHEHRRAVVPARSSRSRQRRRAMGPRDRHGRAVSVRDSGRGRSDADFELAALRQPAAVPVRRTGDGTPRAPRSGRATAIEPAGPIEGPPRRARTC